MHLFTQQVFIKYLLYPGTVPGMQPQSGETCGLSLMDFMLGWKGKH